MEEKKEILLPDEVEGEGATVEEPEEKTEGEKKLLERQKKFEFKEKYLEPEELEKQKKEEFKEVLLKWVLVGIVALGIAFLGYILL